MSLSETAEAAADVAQVLAVLVGGTWAYVKFIRGRTFRRRGELCVTGTLMGDQANRAILVRLEFKNTGLSQIVFEKRSDKAVFVYELLPKDWPSGSGRNIDWGEREDHRDKHITSSLALRDHNWVEPGETITDELLIPMHSGDEPPLAYQVVARATVPRRRGVFWTESGPVWTARLVLPSRLKMESSTELSTSTVTG
jgi:hypothetical protein